MDILDRIEQAMMAEERREKTAHFPSECTACIRQVWYKWQGNAASDPIEPASLWRMGIGNAIHSILPEYMKAAGFAVEEEKSILFEHPRLTKPISGRMDIIFKENGSWEVLEVKSTYGRGIRSIRESGAPRQEHYDQLVMYIHMGDFKRGHILYLGRDDAYRTMFHFGKSEETAHRFNNLLNRFAMIEHYLKEEKVPPREFTATIRDGEIVPKFQHNRQEYKGEWQCNYCRHAKHCWANVLAQMGKFMGEERIA